LYIIPKTLIKTEVVLGGLSKVAEVNFIVPPLFHFGVQTARRACDAGHFAVSLVFIVGVI